MAQQFANVNEPFNKLQYGGRGWKEAQYVQKYFITNFDFGQFHYEFALTFKLYFRVYLHIQFCNEL